MKRRMGIVLLTIFVLVAAFVVPVYADPPVYEEWNFMRGGAGGAVVISYIINTTTLKTTQFNVINNTDEPVYVYVMVNGEVTWDFLVEGPATASKSCVLNFQRLPKTDPDDPDSIRMPRDTSIGARYPAY